MDQTRPAAQADGRTAVEELPVVAGSHENETQAHIERLEQGGRVLEQGMYELYRELVSMREGVGQGAGQVQQVLQAADQKLTSVYEFLQGQIRVSAAEMEDKLTGLYAEVGGLRKDFATYWDQ